MYEGQPILYKHATYPEFLRVATDDEKTYFAFSTIRNPLDQAVSRFFKLKTDHKGQFSDPQRIRAKRWINRATVIQLAVSVPGAVGVQLLVDPTAAIPLVVVTVGVYLLALAPVVGRAHLWLAGALLVVIPLFTLLTADGMARVVVTGLVCGTAFLAKGAVDVLLAVRHRSA